MTALPRQNTSWIEIKTQCAIDAKCRPADVEAVFQAWLSAVGGSLKKNSDVQIDSFGTFSIGKRAARNINNFFTGGIYKKPAKKVAKFRFTPGLKLRIKERGFN